MRVWWKMSRMDGGRVFIIGRGVFGVGFIDIFAPIFDPSSKQSISFLVYLVFDYFDPLILWA